MCGYIGAREINGEAILTGLGLLKHRGTDGFGWMDDSLSTGKGKHKASVFKKKRVFSNIIIHNRAASIGGVTEDLIHPMTTKFDNKNFATMQNGTNKKLFELYATSTLKSDTQVLGDILPMIYDNPAAVKRLIGGSGNVFVKAKDKLLVHIDTSRPLFINTDRTLFASEPITVGDWQSISPVVKIFDGIADFMENCEVRSKVITVNYGDSIIPKRCKSCFRTHYHSKDGEVCYECEVLGRKPPVYKQVNTKSTYTQNYVSKTPKCNKPVNLSSAKDAINKSVYVDTKGDAVAKVGLSYSTLVVNTLIVCKKTRELFMVTDINNKVIGGVTVSTITVKPTGGSNVYAKVMTKLIATQNYIGYVGSFTGVGLFIASNGSKTRNVYGSKQQVIGKLENGWTLRARIFISKLCLPVHPHIAV